MKSNGEKYYVEKRILKLIYLKRFISDINENIFHFFLFLNSLEQREKQLESSQIVKGLFFCTPFNKTITSFYENVSRIGVVGGSVELSEEKTRQDKSQKLKKHNRNYKKIKTIILKSI